MTETKTERTEIQQNEETRIHVVHAALSMIVPGLGQLLQGRIGAFAGYLLLFGVTAFIPAMTVMRCIRFLPPFLWNDLFPSLLLFLFPLAVILFSILDAASWQRDKEARFAKSLERWAKAVLFFHIALFLVLFWLIPTFQANREAARRYQCTNNLKMILLAMHNYHDTYQSLPPAFTVDQDGKPLHSWRVLLLPFLEQEELYARIRLEEPWNSEYNRQFHSTRIDTFRCENDQRYGIIPFLKKRHPEINTDGLCSYSVVLGPETPFPGEEPVAFKEIKDGTSHTIGVVERMVPVCWMNPLHEIPFETASQGVNCEPNGLGSPHQGGCNIALMDGFGSIFKGNDRAGHPESVSHQRRRGTSV